MKSSLRIIDAVLSIFLLAVFLNACGGGMPSKGNNNLSSPDAMSQAAAVSNTEDKEAHKHKKDN